jgi:hypothetical protein
MAPPQSKNTPTASMILPAASMTMVITTPPTTQSPDTPCNKETLMTTAIYQTTQFMMLMKYIVALSTFHHPNLKINYVNKLSTFPVDTLCCFLTMDLLMMSNPTQLPIKLFWQQHPATVKAASDSVHGLLVLP